MVEKQVAVNLKTGLRTRESASLFVQEANKYTSEVFVSKGAYKVNAKNIMDIMILAISNSSEILISAEGNDADEAVEALSSIVGEEKLQS